MCLPVAAAMALTSVASTGMQIQSQKATARQQAQVHSTNQELAHREAIRTYEQNAKREAQEMEAAAGSISRTRRQAQQALGLARVGAGGTAGTDVDLLLNDFEAQTLRNKTDVIRNLDATRDQIAVANSAVTDQSQARVLNTLPNVTQPDFLGSLFRIGASALQGYTQGGGFDGPTSRPDFTPTPQAPGVRYRTLPGFQ